MDSSSEKPKKQTELDRLYLDTKNDTVETRITNSTHLKNSHKTVLTKSKLELYSHLLKQKEDNLKSYFSTLAKNQIGNAQFEKSTLQKFFE